MNLAINVIYPLKYRGTLQGMKSPLGFMAKRAWYLLSVSKTVSQAISRSRSPCDKASSHSWDTYVPPHGKCQPPQER